MNLLRSLLVLTALASFLTGCSTPNRAAGLYFELGSITRDAQGEPVATVRIVNPNVIAYNVARTSHRVFLQDRLVGIVDLEGQGVPQQSVLEQSGKIKLERGAMLPSGSVPYRLDSLVTVRVRAEQTERLSFRNSGVVSLP
jgi:hypothetical protein